MIKLKDHKGITLIALVITIIVLLILAGITIAQITGQDSAPQKATEAREKNDLANELEEIKLCVVNSISKGLTGLVTDDKLREELNGKVKNIVTNADNTWTIEANSGMQYKINSGGMVTEVLKVTDIQAPSELIEIEQGSSLDLSTHITTTPPSNIENLKYTKIGNNEKVIVNEGTGMVSVATDATVGDEVSIEIVGSLSTNVKTTCKIKIIKGETKAEKINKLIGNIVTDYGNVIDSGYDGTWRIFYADDENNEVYLITTDTISSNIAFVNNSGIPLTSINGLAYTGSYNVAISNYGKKWNSKWLNVLNQSIINDSDNNPPQSIRKDARAKATAYLCDYTNWNKFLSQNAPEGSYVVGGPTCELLIKSLENRPNGKKITSNNYASTYGHYEGAITNWITEDLVTLMEGTTTKGLYNNGSSYFLASPSYYGYGGFSDKMNAIDTTQNGTTYYGKSCADINIGVRPIAIIPMSSVAITQSTISFIE